MEWKHSSDPLAGGEEARCPLPKNPSPALGPSDLSFAPPCDAHPLMLIPG